MQWTSINGKNYWLSSNVASFADATKTCNDMGGYLAEPTSATENDELTKLINDKDSGSVWIGVDDIAEEALTIGNGYDL